MALRSNGNSKKSRSEMKPHSRNQTDDRGNILTHDSQAFPNEQPQSQAAHQNFHNPTPQNPHQAQNPHQQSNQQTHTPHSVTSTSSENQRDADKREGLRDTEDVGTHTKERLERAARETYLHEQHQTQHQAQPQEPSHARSQVQPQEKPHPQPHARPHEQPQAPPQTQPMHQNYHAPSPQNSRQAQNPQNSYQQPRQKAHAPRSTTSANTDNQRDVSRRVTLGEKTEDVRAKTKKRRERAARETYSNEQSQAQTQSQPQEQPQNVHDPTLQNLQQAHAPQNAHQQFMKNTHALRSAISTSTDNLLDAGERVFLGDAEDAGVQTIKRHERVARGTFDMARQLASAQDAGWRRNVFAAPAIAATVVSESMPDKTRGEDSGAQVTRTGLNEAADIAKIIATAPAPVRLKLQRDFAQKQAAIAALESEVVAIEGELGNAKDAAENANWRVVKINQRVERLEAAAEKLKAEKSAEKIGEKFVDAPTENPNAAPLRHESPQKKLQHRRQQRREQQRRQRPGLNRRRDKSEEKIADAKTPEVKTPSPKTPTARRKSNVSRASQNRQRHLLEKKLAKAKSSGERAVTDAKKTKAQLGKVETVAHNAKENLMRERATLPPLKLNAELAGGAGVAGGMLAHGGQKIIDTSHSKISEIEDDIGNSGLKAVHGIEQRAENAARSTFRRVRRIRRRLKQHAERELKKKKLNHASTATRKASESAVKSASSSAKSAASAEAKKTAAAATKKAARKAARKKAMIAKAKVVKAKAVAAKGTFMAGKTAFLAGKTAASIKAGAATGGISLAVQAAIYLAIILVALLVLAIVLVVLVIMFIVSIFAGGVSMALETSSYTADPHDMTAASAYMTELQVDFVENIHDAMQGGDEVILIINGEMFTFPVSITGGHGGTFLDGGTVASPTDPNIIPSTTPDIPALRSLLPEISHCPWEVMAYLTIFYRDFDGVDIFEVLEALFNSVFEFSYTTHTETRTHTVPISIFVTTADGIIQVEPTSITVTVEIEVRTVTVTTNGTISDAISDRLDELTEKLLEEDEDTEPLPHDLFDLLMATSGLRQIILSPFEGDWRGSVSSPFGYRFHPVFGDRRFHTGIDIARPEGTPILSGFIGEYSVIAATYMGGYGLTVILELTVPESGLTVRLLYAHMETILVNVGTIVSDEQIVLGTVGQTGTATGPHLHLEVMVRAEGETEFRYLDLAFFVLPMSVENP